MGLRALVINPSGEEVLGIVGDVLREAGAEVEELASKAVADMLVSGPPSPSARVVPVLPESSGCHDLLVILGSPLGVLTSPPQDEDDVQTPPGVIRQIEALVCDFHREEKPVLGICLGSQLVARAFGGAVSKMPKDPAHTAVPLPADGAAAAAGAEFGWHAQDFLPAAERDPVVGPALQAMRAELAARPDGPALGAARAAPAATAAGCVPKFMQWHSDTFQIPTGAVQLSARPTCQAQAFRMGNRTYAFQYHIEVDESLGRQWYQDYIEGADSFAERAEWERVDSQSERALKEHLSESIAGGAVAAAEAFTRTAVRRLLAEASAARRRRAVGGPVRMAVAVAVAMGVLAVGLRLLRRA